MTELGCEGSAKSEGGSREKARKKAQEMVEHYEERQIELEKRKKHLEALLQETENKIQQMISKRKRWEDKALGRGVD